jgi:hypothetical protein
MRYAALAFAISAVAFACSNGDDPDPIDAPASQIDAPPGNACTGAVYDSCTMASQCTSGNCKLFSGDGFQVCTQACSAANPCPTVNGIAGTCNNMGICKPAQAHACTPQ